MIAQVVHQGWAAGWSLGGLAILIVILAALAAVVLVAVRGMGITLPPWLTQIAAIVVIAVVAILAIKLILSM